MNFLNIEQMSGRIDVHTNVHALVRAFITSDLGRPFYLYGLYFAQSNFVRRVNLVKGIPLEPIVTEDVYLALVTHEGDEYWLESSDPLHLIAGRSYNVKRTSTGSEFEYVKRHDDVRDTKPDLGNQMISYNELDFHASQCTKAALFPVLHTATQELSRGLDQTVSTTLAIQHQGHTFDSKALSIEYCRNKDYKGYLEFCAEYKLQPINEGYLLAQDEPNIAAFKVTTNLVFAREPKAVPILDPQTGMRYEGLIFKAQLVSTRFGTAYLIEMLGRTLVIHSKVISSEYLRSKDFLNDCSCPDKDIYVAVPKAHIDTSTNLTKWLGVNYMKEGKHQYTDIVAHTKLALDWPDTKPVVGMHPAVIIDEDFTLAIISNNRLQLALHVAENDWCKYEEEESSLFDSTY